MARLEVITGPMFSGKSEELLRRLKRAAYARKSILLLKPRVDNRSARNIFQFIKDDRKLSRYEYIINRAVGSIEEFDNIYPRDFDVVAIDEIQFFGKWLLDAINNTLGATAQLNVTLIISGLDMDAWRKPFGIMPDLMAMADDVLKLNAICQHCSGKNGPAIFTQKKSNSHKVVEVGDEDLYEARCRVCHTIPE